MSVDWDSKLCGMDENDSWKAFKNKLSESMEEYIMYLKTRRAYNIPLWMNKNITQLIKKKRRLWKWYKTTNNFLEYTAYLDV